MTVFELTVDTSLSAAIIRIVKEKNGEDTPIEVTRTGNRYYIDIGVTIPQEILLEIRDEILDILESQRYIGSFKVL